MLIFRFIILFGVITRISRSKNTSVFSYWSSAATLYSPSVSYIVSAPVSLRILYPNTKSPFDWSSSTRLTQQQEQQVVC